MGRKTIMNKDGLNDKEQIFVAEYLLDYNAKRAAEAAGYSKNAALKCANKILARKEVKAVIKKAQERALMKLQLSRDAILAQLAAWLLRDTDNMVDEQGRPIKNLRQLSQCVKDSVDGIKIKERTFINSEGEEQSTVETELKLVSKADAAKLLMQHLGMFAPGKQQIQHAIDWDSLVAPPEQTKADSIEQRIAAEGGDALPSLQGKTK